MKILHLADLHLGKRICERSLLDDQRFLLNQVLQCIIQKQVDAVLIAGDVYDRPAPPPDAVTLLDGFLTALEDAGVPCLLIPGNHDSDERLAFGARLLGGAGVHLAPVFDGRLRTVTLADQYGPVQFTLLPFLRPAQVRRFFPDVPPGDYEAAIRAVLGTVDTADGGRHVLLAHPVPRPRAATPSWPRWARLTMWTCPRLMGSITSRSAISMARSAWAATRCAMPGRRSSFPSPRRGITNPRRL